MENQSGLKDFLYRTRDPRLVASHALWRATQAYDLIAPTAFSRLYRKVRGTTMCSNARLRGLYRAVNGVIRKQVPGDIVECGTARGGSAALMALTLEQANDRERSVWVFDTFEGLPPPTADDPDFEIAKRFTGTCLGSLEDVSGLFSQLGLSRRTRFVKGLFQDTLPTAPVAQISVLHLDGDWYESMMSCLENLYDRVSPGGVIQIDDYGFWEGARKAVHDFFDRRSISPVLTRLDYSGRQFIKQ
jgi:hypothetical protein